MQTQITMSYCYTLIRMSKLRRGTLPRAGEDVDKWELSHTAGKNVKWYNHFANPFVSRIIILLPYDPTILLLGYFPKKKESICPYRNLYINTHHNFVSNKPQTRNNPMSIKRWTATWVLVYSCNVILFSNNRKWAVDTHSNTWMNFKIIVRMKEARQTCYMIPNLFCSRKCKLILVIWNRSVATW